MPSLEQIVRPFVVDPTLPPVPYITTANDPPPEPVRLNIGIGGTQLQSLPASVKPTLPPPPLPAAVKLTPPKITFTTLSSSYSIAATWYMHGVVKEKTTDGGFGPFGLGAGFGIGAGFGGATGFEPG